MLSQAVPCLVLVRGWVVLAEPRWAIAVTVGGTRIGEMAATLPYLQPILNDWSDAVPYRPQCASYPGRP